MQGACADNGGPPLQWLRFPSLIFERLVHSNLGGHGPDVGEEGLVFECRRQGGGRGEPQGNRKVYLEVHAMSNYRPTYPKLNGLKGMYGIINLEPNSSVQLAFRIRSSTGKPLRLPSVSMTFFDLDKESGQHGVEYIRVDGFKDFRLTKHTELQVVEQKGGLTEFRATRRGGAFNNPFGVKPPSRLLERRAVGVLYAHVCEMNVTMGVDNKGYVPRFFMFVSRLFPCTMTVHLGNSSMSALMHELNASSSRQALRVRHRGDAAANSILRPHWWWENPLVLLTVFSLLLMFLQAKFGKTNARDSRTVAQLAAQQGARDHLVVRGTACAIAARQSGDFKWNGIAALGAKLYCAPFHADEVLVIDPLKRATRTITTSTSSNGKWCGIVPYKGKLYCAPFNSDDVLVIDPSTNSTMTIATGHEGNFKWAGIAVLGDKLYCAPHDADEVLVIDPKTGRASTIGTGQSGSGKWHGITALGDKLYCAPFNAEDVLVVDPALGAVSFIPSGNRGRWKWAGIVSLGVRLYCAPHDADDVLVIDPAQGSTWTILTGLTGIWKWAGIVALGEHLYCAPFCATDVLVVSPEARRTCTIRTQGESGHKSWASIAELGGRLYCAPYCADQALQVSVGVVTL